MSTPAASDLDNGPSGIPDVTPNSTRPAQTSGAGSLSRRSQQVAQKRKPGEPVEPVKRDDQAKLKVATILSKACFLLWRVACCGCNNFYGQTQELNNEVRGVHLSIHAWQAVQKDGSRQVHYAINGHAGLKSLASTYDVQTGQWVLNDLWYTAIAAALFSAPTAE
jgi:hypothetical protein